MVRGRVVEVERVVRVVVAVEDDAVEREVEERVLVLGVSELELSVDKWIS